MGSISSRASVTGASAAADFDRDGWIVARGIVARDEIAAMAEVFASLITEDGAVPVAGGGVLGEVTGGSRTSGPLARIARDSRFGALAAEVLGVGRVQLLQDSLLYKPAREGGAVAWHQDFTYVGFLAPPRVVSLRIPLLPEREESGCMRVVQGSHRWGQVGKVRALTSSQVDSILPSLSPGQLDAVARSTPLLLDPGDVSLHHCLTLHGSGPNLSGRPRRTIILRLFDGDCRLNAARLPPGVEPYFPTDADGRLAASSFPVVFG